MNGFKDVEDVMSEFYSSSATTSAKGTEPSLTRDSIVDMINSIPVKESPALPGEMREPRLNSWIKKHIKDKGLLGKIFYKSVPCAYVMNKPEIFVHPKHYGAFLKGLKL